MKLSQTEVGCFSGFKFAPYTVTKAQRLPATMGRAQISRVIRSYGSKERQSPSSHRPLFYSFHACSFVFGFSQISQARCTCYSFLLEYSSLRFAKASTPHFFRAALPPSAPPSVLCPLVLLYLLGCTHCLLIAATCTFTRLFSISSTRMKLHVGRQELCLFHCTIFRTSNSA